MGIINEYLVIEKKSTNGEDKTYTDGQKKMWIPFGKISWAAILAGVLVTTVAQMLLSLLGLGIGMGTIDPLSEQDPAGGLGLGTIAWWSVSMLIALFVGGLTTGKLYQIKSKAHLTWHGLLTWSTFTVFSFFMLTTTVGKLVSGMGNIIGTAVTAGATVNQDKQLDISGITRDAKNFFMMPNQTNSTDTETGIRNNQNINTEQRNATTRSAQISSQPNRSTSDQTVAEDVQSTTSKNQTLVDEVQTFFKGGNVQGPEARESLINTIVRQTGMSRTEASAKVDNWMSSYENLKENARIKADKAAKTISTASIVGFFALIIGALVTIWGTRMAYPKEVANTNKVERSLR